MATKQEIIKAAITSYGEPPQIDMAIEECAELILALCHNKRKRATLDQIRTEIADVIIMAEQMREIFGTVEVDQEIDIKISRLGQKLGMEYEINLQ